MLCGKLHCQKSSDFIVFFYTRSGLRVEGTSPAQVSHFDVPAMGISQMSCGFKVYQQSIGSWFRSGPRISGFGFLVSVFVLRVPSSGFQVSGSGVMVSGLGIRV